MARTILWAAISSAIVALLVPAILFLTINKAAVLKDGALYPADFYEWSYHNQYEWRLKNLDLVEGFAYVRERMKYPQQFAEEFAIAAGSTFAVGFISCLLFAFLGRQRPNPALNRTSRKRAAG